MLILAPFYTGSDGLLAGGRDTIQGTCGAEGNMHNIEGAAELLDGVGVAKPEIEQAVRRLLEAFGEDVSREGLERTPNRVARMYDELLAGYRVDPHALVNDALFDVDYDEMVIVRNIEFYSLCEHHMLPFLGRAHVSVLPEGQGHRAVQDPAHR